LTVLDLNTYTVKPANVTMPLLGNPNFIDGGYYKGEVFSTGCENKNASSPRGISSIDPIIGSGSTIIRTYNGVSFKTMDYLYWVLANTSADSTSCTHAGEDNLFFTSIDLSANGETNYLDTILNNVVYRYMRLVISQVT